MVPQSKLVFYVNGRKVEDPDVDPQLSLLRYLRQTCRLTGTKPSCEEGGCGACTVMISHFERATRTIHHRAVVACLLPVCAVHGCAVTTVEGVGSTRDGLHPIQARLAAFHGVQCGFCSPGMVMSMYALLRSNPTPTKHDIERAIAGNLCRCTGYRPILQGFQTFTQGSRCALGDACCQNQSEAQQADDNTHLARYDPTQEPIFPSQLQTSDMYDTDTIMFRKGKVTWYRPTTLKALLELREANPTAVLVSGFTQVVRYMKATPGESIILVAVSHVPELHVIEEGERGLVIGGAVTLVKLQSVIDSMVTRMPEEQMRNLRALSDMIGRFGGQQIRNMATLGGAVVSAWTNSDINVVLLAAGASVRAVSTDGSVRGITMDAGFFQTGSQTLLRKDETLTDVIIPYSHKTDHICAYKQAWRRNFDYSIVNAGIRLTIDGSTGTVRAASLAFGGIGPTIIVPTRTAAMLTGRTLDESTFEEACRCLDEEIDAVVSADHADFRKTLALSFLFKFYVTIRVRLTGSGLDVRDRDMSAARRCYDEPKRGLQVFDDVPDEQLEVDPVGRPVEHVAARQMVSGEAVYTTDIVSRDGELFLALVTSTKAHARIVSVDTSDALGMPGVVGYVDHTDVRGSNLTGLFGDEEIFATKEVICQGQVIGAIGAESEAQARTAAKVVKVVYDELPVITSIEEAINARSFVPPPLGEKRLDVGDVSSGLRSSDHVIEGEVRIGAQDHYYMETQCCLVVPSGEADELEILVGTQNPSGAQRATAAALNIPHHKVVVRAKRSGGAFGGKDTRPTLTLMLLPAAVAAYKFRRPVRIRLTREEDITMTGGRHPFLAKYKVGFTAEGLLTALDCDLYSNGGGVHDLSPIVHCYALAAVDNSYKFANLSARSRVCHTNVTSPTAMRGFGQPQGLFVCENVISDVAAFLGLPVEQVRDINLYKDGEEQLTGLKMAANLRRCWDQVMADSQFAARRQQVDEFNRSNRWKKRGIAAIPVKYGIGPGVTHLMQAGALVNVYTDGSVLLAHGGNETGQGLHTKMVQVASRVLGIGASRIHIPETSTNTVPNTASTGGSVGSDLNGPAVRNACQKIVDRLCPYRQANPEGSWEDWVKEAYNDRVSLSATGHYQFAEKHEIGRDWDTGKGPLFIYYSYGAGCTEVEIDCLTGEHVMLRTDIVMDVGRSLNPAIDIGQIEGAFMQGRGMFTMEELHFGPDGRMHTRGPGTYKIPTVGDIPMVFNVALLKGSSNSRVIYSSKGIGEPPLFLGASAFFAIKDAVKSARADSGLTGRFRLDSPATAERIRMACVDRFTKLGTSRSKQTVPAWTA